MNALRISIIGAVALTALSQAGCGGSGSNSGTPTYTIGGVVLGLAGNGTVKLVNGKDTLTVSSDGSFTMPSAVVNDATYSLTVATNPTNQSCGVLNGANIVNGADVTGIYVYCTYNVTAASLSGSYDYADFDVNSNTDTLYSGVPFDGVGSLGASSVMSDQGGTTFATSTNGGGAYTVATVLALPVLTVETVNIGGIAGADGDEFYWLGNATGGSGPSLALGVKPLTGATTASLAGSWVTAGLTQDATSPYATAATLTINADGSFTGNQSTFDVAGTAATQAVTGAANGFSVSNGIVTAGGSSGYLSANGEFLVMTSVAQTTGGGTANYPGLTAAVKLGTGVTEATLNGVYSVGSLAFDTAVIGDGESFTLFFDGAGDFSGTATENENGSASTSNTWSGTYTVTPTGLLTLTDSNSNVYNGAVSADGNIVVAAAVTSGGTAPPRMFAGFRQ